MSFGQTSLWDRPGVAARFYVLLNIDPKLTYAAIAQQLNEEFGIALTKNSCVGFGRRNGVPKRQPPRNYAGRRPRTLKARPRPLMVPKQHLAQPVRIKPRPVPGKLRIWQLEHNECRWPIDNVSPFFFCAKKQMPGQSYCLEHAHRSCPSLGRDG